MNVHSFCRKSITVILGSLILIGLLPLFVYGGNVVEIDADRQFDFAEHLFSGREYRRAVDEYQRFIYYFPEDERVEQAQYQIGRAFFYSAQYREAIAAFKILTDRMFERPAATAAEAVKAYFALTECYVQLRQFKSALIHLNNLIVLTDDPAIKDQSHYRSAWIYIEMGLWGKAAAALSHIRPQTSRQYGLPELSLQLQEILAGKSRILPQKNPALAGTLAVVPGTGYVYCNRYRDALISFLVNGGLICATWQAFDNDNTALGVMLGILGSGFYTGNIYGSVTAAHKYNRSKQADFIDQLKNTYRYNPVVGLVPDVRNKGVVLSFRYRF